MSAPTPSRRSPAIALVGVLIVAAGLRLYRLNAESLWLDEAFSLTLARGPWANLFAEAIEDFHPPLYFVLLKIWCGFAGDSAWAARLFSVVISTATVATAYVAGRRFFGPTRGQTVGLAAALLLTVSTFQVEFAQEARMYALLNLLAAWSTLALAALMARPAAAPGARASQRAWWLYVVTSAGLVYTQAVSFFVFLAHALVVMGSAVRTPVMRRAAERWVLAGLAVGVVFLPWVSAFALQFTTVQRGFWIADPTATDLPRTVEVFAGSTPLALIVGGLAVTGALTMTRARERRADDVPVGWILVAWTIVPIVGPYLASLVGTPIFLPKYTIAASMPLALLAGAGLLVLPRLVGGAMLVAVLLLSSQALGAFHAKPRKDDGRGAVADVEAAATPRATVLLYPYYVAYPWRIYASRPDLVVSGFPKHAADTTTPTLQHLFDTLAPAPEELWLVVIGYDPRRDALVTHLGTRYASVERRARGHVDVYRGTRPRTPQPPVTVTAPH